MFFLLIDTYTIRIKGIMKSTTLSVNSLQINHGNLEKKKLQNHSFPSPSHPHRHILFRHDSTILPLKTLLLPTTKGFLPSFLSFSFVICIIPLSLPPLLPQLIFFSFSFGLPFFPT